MASSGSAAAMAADGEDDAPLFGEKVVLPGDDVTELVESAADARPGAAIKLGAGLVPLDDGVVATRAGILSHKEPARFFLLSNHRRYYPAVGDAVVGVITDRNAEQYRVRLHGTTNAVLPVLAFDGATKRNKPNLAIGALVFARVAVVSKFMDTELTCQAVSGTTRKDWMTGQSVYGELKDGHLITVGLAHARRLLNPACAVLTRLGAHVPFEVAVGVNGLVYVRAASTRHITVICNAIERSEPLSEEDSAVLVERILAVLAR